MEMWVTNQGDNERLGDKQMTFLLVFKKLDQQRNSELRKSSTYTGRYVIIKAFEKQYRNNSGKQDY
jgi:hypothetical protein